MLLTSTALPMTFFTNPSLRMTAMMSVLGKLQIISLHSVLAGASPMISTEEFPAQNKTEFSSLKWIWAWCEFQENIRRSSRWVPGISARDSARGALCYHHRRIHLLFRGSTEIVGLSPMDCNWVWSKLGANWRAPEHRYARPRMFRVEARPSEQIHIQLS